MSICKHRRTIFICNTFAAEHYLIFNSKKSLAIKYGKEVNDTEYVLLGQNKINWVDSVKHLAITLTRNYLIVLTV